jgi:hypothetical protein
MENTSKKGNATLSNHDTVGVQVRELGEKCPFHTYWRSVLAGWRCDDRT